MKKDKGVRVRSILAAGPGLLSAAHTSISQLAWAFVGIVNYSWIFFFFFQHDTHIVLCSTKAFFQGRISSSRPECEYSQTVTLRKEHFLNPSAFISRICVPAPSLLQPLTSHLINTGSCRLVVSKQKGSCRMWNQTDCFQTN